MNVYDLVCYEETLETFKSLKSSQTANSNSLKASHTKNTSPHLAKPLITQKTFEGNKRGYGSNFIYIFTTPFRRKKFQIDFLKPKSNKTKP